MHLIIFVLLVILILYLEYKDRSGSHKVSVLDLLRNARSDLEDKEIQSWGEEFKNKLRSLGSAAFNALKNRGVRKVEKHELVPSRGYDKLLEILRATGVRIEGQVLSLCCGRGGWEHLYASSPAVTRVTAVTFGKQPHLAGHEDFTDKHFPGREKVLLINGDARKIPITEHDTLLFDGGESHPSYTEESKKFNDLFHSSVMRQITPKTKNFVLKILTPTHELTRKMMAQIQQITGKGSLYRTTVSKNTNLEMYFISTRPANIDNQLRKILKWNFDKALENKQLEARRIGPEYSYTREEIKPTRVKLIKPPDYTKSIQELGQQLPEQGRLYNHWESVGVYPIGTEGSSGMSYNPLGRKVASKLIPSLREFDRWKLTDTTPKGFVDVFSKKYDVGPKENTKYADHMHEVYEGMTDFYQKRGFKLKEMSWEEVEKQANKQGAPGYQDVREHIQNLGEYLKLPDWRKRVERIRDSFNSGNPLQGIFNTMGKREKKKSDKPKGSRMIAYLNIGPRLLEMKVLGNLMKLVKPTMTRFAVGGLGLHDLGSRLQEIWLGKSVSDDVASFDCRVGLRVMSEELNMIKRLGGNKTAESLYSIYAHPAILIPIPHEFRRGELLKGQGQRMSGVAPTYSMNTITRIAVLLTCLAVKFNIPLREIRSFVREMMEGKTPRAKKINAAVSGDDAVVMSDDDIITEFGEIMEELGFPRKNVPGQVKSPVATSVNEVEFCSHFYEKISYYDSYTGATCYKYVPTRDVTEIVAKSLMRVGGQDRDLDSMAWLSAQGNNLLVNYPHLRTCRALGFAYKAVCHPNVILTDTGGFIRPKPWMRQGDILDVFNEVMFGGSTQYPVEGFRVRKWGHVGYMSPKREITYDPNCFGQPRCQWRRHLLREVSGVIYEMSTGGDTTILEEWRDHG